MCGVGCAMGVAGCLNPFSSSADPISRERYPEWLSTRMAENLGDNSLLLELSTTEAFDEPTFDNLMENYSLAGFDIALDSVDHILSISQFDSVHGENLGIVAGEFDAETFESDVEEVLANELLIEESELDLEAGTDHGLEWYTEPTYGWTIGFSDTVLVHGSTKPWFDAGLDAFFEGEDRLIDEDADLERAQDWLTIQDQLLLEVESIEPELHVGGISQDTGAGMQPLELIFIFETTDDAVEAKSEIEADFETEYLEDVELTHDERRITVQAESDRSFIEMVGPQSPAPQIATEWSRRDDTLYINVVGGETFTAETVRITGEGMHEGYWYEFDEDAGAGETVTAGHTAAVPLEDDAWEGSVVWDPDDEPPEVIAENEAS